MLGATSSSWRYYGPLVLTELQRSLHHTATLLKAISSQTTSIQGKHAYLVQQPRH